MAELIVSSRAEADIGAAFDWYEACCPGLGTQFVVTVDAALAAIQRNPAAFVVRHAGHRMAVLARFPYGVFFIFDRDRDLVSVRRVIHFHRDIPRQL